MYFKEDSIIYKNGKFIPVNEEQTTLYGQTLHYGYGVFEGIRAYNTKQGTQVFKAKEHYERFKQSCDLIHIPFHYSIDELIDVTYKLLEKNNLSDAYIRPLIYTNPNMSLTKPDNSNIFIAVWNWEAYMGEKLLKIKTSSYQRPNPKSTHVEAKVCGHYVNSILATIEAKEAGFDEALLLDSHLFLAEGAGANLFFEKEKQLFTPDVGNILPGITRATIIELCNEFNIKVTIGNYRLDDIHKADSAFYCGTAAEVVGFECLDSYIFPQKWEQSLGFKLKKAYLELVTKSII